MILRKSHFIVARILAFSLVTSLGSWVYGTELVSRDDSPSTTSEPAPSDGTVRYVKTSLGVTRRIVGVMNAPRVMRRVYPRLPGEARSARVQGLVQMEVLIDTSGKVKKVNVTKGLSHGLSEAAVEAVKQWVFEPVVVGDAAMPALIDVVVSFKL